MLAPSAARSGAHVPSPKAPDAGAAHTIPDGLVAVTQDLIAAAPAGPNSHDAVTNLDWCTAEAARIGAQGGRIARVVRCGALCTVYATRVVGTLGIRGGRVIGLADVSFAAEVPHG